MFLDVYFPRLSYSIWVHYGVSGYKLRIHLFFIKLTLSACECAKAGNKFVV
jgi:hypothetical protein